MHKLYAVLKVKGAVIGADNNTVLQTQPVPEAKVP